MIQTLYRALDKSEVHITNSQTKQMYLVQRSVMNFILVAQPFAWFTTQIKNKMPAYLEFDTYIIIRGRRYYL